MNNLAELILNRAQRRPQARFGMAESPLTLAEAVALARRGASQLAGSGLKPGARAALIGETSNSYLLAWMMLQLAGIEAALINPALPADLLRAMLAQLNVDAVLWVNRLSATEIAPHALHLSFPLAEGESQGAPDSAEALGGLARAPESIAGYMHTSGTTGAPKFCAQSHHYFLALGRFIADSMALSSADTVFAPLPMFHINPLGYGVIGGLTGGADVLGAPKFSAGGFWPMVKETQTTVAFLHAPPVAILKKTTSAADAAGHRLRAAFLADAEFIERFQVPLAYSGYGSTEAGGLCHIGTWRRGDECPHPEGMARYGGNPRPDVEWRLADDGEIWIRGQAAHVLCDGYQYADGLQPLTDADDWFHTGDVGRADAEGHLIFIERRAESIRVKGEYVPIEYVEQTLSGLALFHEVALWRRANALTDQEVVLYVVTNGAALRGHHALNELARKALTLPSFMRPEAVVRLAEMPRGAGVGKILRRLLDTVTPLETIELSPLYGELRADQ